ncbi:MAG TPA: hypothetical protein VGK67_38290, partial [Myxococcales bacterium]
MPSNLLALTALLSLTNAAAPAGNINVQVLSATSKDKVVPEAQVIFQKDGQTSLTGKTDAQGKASVANSLGVDDGTVSLIIKKDGFSPLVVKCPCNGMSYAVSETLQQLEAFRVVLNWGDQPRDLDLHVVYPGNHIYFEKKNGTDAFLDVDDTDGFGPETLTIKKRHPGEQYVFAIHNYSANQQYGTKSLSGQSQAKVFVYVGQSLLKSYYVPQGKTGSMWVLFALDGNGAFHDINNVVDVAEYKKVAVYLKQITDRAGFGAMTRASVSDQETAKELTGKADEALAAGSAEKAVELLQVALERNPNLGVAYASLAKAYTKLGRSAEAAWATRKADEIAKAPATRYRVPNDKITLEASSSMKDWKQYTFVAPNLLDDNLWTSWQPVTKPAGGVGDFVKFTFASPQTISGFEFSNGFRRIDEMFGDLYHMNNRMKAATLEFSDGEKMQLAFKDDPTEETVLLPTPKKCAWVKLTVNEIYKGTKWNDLAISEIHPL